MREYDKNDGTEPGHDHEWVKCMTCKRYAMAKYEKTVRVHTSKQVFNQKIYSLPEGWVGTLEEAMCPICWKEHQDIQDYQQRCRDLEKARLNKLREAARR